jgi:glycosyltransferase involved in cell wall biosynthesis
MSVVVLLPVYRDAASAAVVIGQLRQALANEDRLSIVVIDDGSIPSIACADLGWGADLTVVTLRRNVGHQRAIAIGLAYIAEQMPADAVLVMDADGQDRVDDAKRLLDTLRSTGANQIVFASRMRRVESLTFRALYHAYRWLHVVLTGVPVRFGNFSAVPKSVLSRLVYSSELWNHYAAAVLKTRLPYTSIPTMRAERVEGETKMNFVSLVVHGLSALSVFSETLGVRLLVASAVGFGVLTVVGAFLIAWQHFGYISFGPIATISGALVLIVALQITSTGAMLALVVLGRRSGTDFVPARDYKLFVESSTTCTRA